jgi:hypothetical protein
MNSDLDQQSNVTMIHQSLNELRELFSALEAQSKLGLLMEPLEMEPIEVISPAAQSPFLDDGYFQADELNGFGEL